MGQGTHPLTASTMVTGAATDNHIAELHDAITRTRSQITSTVDELHGRLNPTVFKNEVLKQFHDAKGAIKDELTTDLVEAKEAFDSGLQDTKESLKAGFTETREHVVEDVKEQLSQAKQAIRRATVGKVETMVYNTQAKLTASGRAVADVIKHNPIPVALVGVGLAWLYASNRSQRTSQKQLPPPRAPAGETSSLKTQASELAEKAERASHRVAESITEASTGAVESTQRLARTVKSSLGHASETATKSATQLAEGAAAGGRRVGHYVEETFMNNPLAVGGAMVAMGAAVGLAIPITQRERQWMGDFRDEVIHKAEALASDACSRMDDAAKQITQGVKEPTVSPDHHEDDHSIQVEGTASANEHGRHDGFHMSSGSAEPKGNHVP